MDKNLAGPVWHITVRDDGIRIEVGPPPVDSGVQLDSTQLLALAEFLEPHDYFVSRFQLYEDGVTFIDEYVSRALASDFRFRRFIQARELLATASAPYEVSAVEFWGPDLRKLTIKRDGAVTGMRSQHEHELLLTEAWKSVGGRVWSAGRK